MATLSAFLLCAFLFAPPRLPMAARRVALVALGVATLWGPGGLPLLAYVRAVVGDLSVPTLFLLGAAVFDAGPRMARTRSALLGLAAAAALLYYPPALGACRFSPYAWGFGDPLFVAGVAALSSALWIARLQVASAVLMAASLAWQLGLGASGNLWDYLVDPLLAGAGIVWAVRALVPRAPSVTDPSS